MDNAQHNSFITYDIIWTTASCVLFLQCHFGTDFAISIDNLIPNLYLCSFFLLKHYCLFYYYYKLFILLTQSTQIQACVIGSRRNEIIFNIIYYLLVFITYAAYVFQNIQSLSLEVELTFYIFLECLFHCALLITMNSE